MNDKEKSYRKRIRYPKEVLDVLEEIFISGTHFVDQESREDIAVRTNLRPEQVRNWFKKRRERARRSEQNGGESVPLKRVVRRLPPEAVAELERLYSRGMNRPSTQVCEVLAARHGLKQKQVKKWFNNRQRLKRPLNEDGSDLSDTQPVPSSSGVRSVGHLPLPPLVTLPVSNESFAVTTLPPVLDDPPPSEMVALPMDAQGLDRVDTDVVLFQNSGGGGIISMMNVLYDSVPVRHVESGDVSLRNAISSAVDGDVLHLQSGEYNASTLRRLDKVVTIRAEENENVVFVLDEVAEEGCVIEACPSPPGVIRLVGVKFEQRHCGGASSSLCIHCGTLALEKCDVFCKAPITVLNGGTLHMRLSKVHGSLRGGIELKPGSRAILEENEICENGRGGVVMQVRQVDAGEVSLEIRKNRIHHNEGYGVLIEKDPYLLHYERPRVISEGNDLQSNLLGEFGERTV